ncbi:Two pore calcium channel protein 2 [Cichlidogyrus casuarinus]|uniref:Two pore calcium channel protein 2 n=1 Tax=Cichlidogyrus casuarinus TaxID=1844966 RepID=A0ABD2PX02_9PLAT
MQVRSIMHRLDKNGIRAYFWLYSKPFYFVTRLALCILMILPFFENPNSLTMTSDLRYESPRPQIPCGVLISIEFLSLIVIALDTSMKLYMFHPYSTARDLIWQLFHIPVLVASLVDICVSLGFLCTEEVQIRRYLRVFFVLSNSNDVRHTVEALVRAMVDIIGAYFLMAITVLIFSMGSVTIFSKPFSKFVSLSTTCRQVFSMILINLWPTTTLSPPHIKCLSSSPRPIAQTVSIRDQLNHFFQTILAPTRRAE